MKEEVLTVLVIVSLALSVFSLVLTLRATPNIITSTNTETDTQRADNFETLLKQYPNVSVYQAPIWQAIAMSKSSGSPTWDSLFFNLNDSATFINYLQTSRPQYHNPDIKSVLRIENTFYIYPAIDQSIGIGYYTP